MPTFRPLPIVLAVLVGVVAGVAAVRAQALPEPSKAPPAGAGVTATPDIEFYLARGEADACGRGCNEWIAAEGKIDGGAAQRLRALLAKLGHRRPPIYFHSPGGSMVGSIELGRLIRDQKLVVSVAHTIPLGCDHDKQLGTSCEAEKHSGQAVEAEFDSYAAICNSACVWVVAGGAVRLIPPWVKLAIHDVGFDSATKRPPRGAVAEEAKRLIHARIQEYSRDLGIDKALYTATTGVPFESRRYLERDELVRFGIDRREFGETVWRFVDNPRPLVTKRFFVRAGGDRSRYFNGSVSLECGLGPALRLALVREHVASEPAGTWSRSVNVSMNGLHIDLPNQVPSHVLDARSGSVRADAIGAIGDNATMGISGFDPTRDDDSAEIVTLNTDGFSAAYAKLRKICDQQARDIIAVTPSTKPAAAPYPFDNSPFARNPPVRPGPTVSQNAPAAQAPRKPETLRSGANGSTPPAQPMAESCTLKIADAPQHRTGRVTGFVSDEDASARTKAVEDDLGAKISPAYLSLRRVEVESLPEGGNWVTMAAIPEHMPVKIDDWVELNGRHRDPTLPCSFVPWTIDRLIDHAK